MRFKTVLPLIFLSVIGVIMSSYFTGSVLLGQTLQPFRSLEEATIEFEGASGDPTTVSIDPDVGRAGTDIFPDFLHGDILRDWVPWIIKQVSILIGALSLIVFVYAGVNLIINGDNEEELGKATKMIIFGVLGIGLAGFSYTIVANVLALL